VANLRFELGDLARLDGFGDRSFDLATVLMALHEMPDPARPAVLVELARVAGQVLVVDFRVPLPRNRSGLAKRLIESAAGPRHFAGFRRYCRLGGLDPIVQSAGLRVVDRHLMDAGTLELIRLER
jgi:ubiquinone/menaquinone biosynthesis C-methylase UbiE